MVFPGGEKPTPADNPAVLRLVQDMMHAAQTRGVPLYLCGIMQKDLETMPAFMRIGVRNFCVESVHINTLKKHSDANRTIKISPHPLPPTAYDKGVGRILMNRE